MVGKHEDVQQTDQKIFDKIRRRIKKHSFPL